MQTYRPAPHPRIPPPPPRPRRRKRSSHRIPQLQLRTLAEVKDLVRQHNTHVVPSRRVRVQQTKKKLIQDLVKESKKPKTRRLVEVVPGTSGKKYQLASHVQPQFRERFDTLSPNKRAALTRHIRKFSKKTAKKTARRERSIAHGDRYGRHVPVYDVFRRSGVLPARAADTITMFVKGLDDAEDPEMSQRSRINKKFAKVRAKATQKRLKGRSIKRLTRLTQPTVEMERRWFQQARAEQGQSAPKPVYALPHEASHKHWASERRRSVHDRGI